MYCTGMVRYAVIVATIYSTVYAVLMLMNKKTPINKEVYIRGNGVYSKGKSLSGWDIDK